MSSVEEHIARLKQDPVLGPLLAPLFLLLEEQAALIKEQALLINAQAAHIAELEAEVAELKARLNQTSRTSHKPPSSDGYRKAPAPLKKTSGKRGGQHGHKGDTLKMVETPDEIDLKVVTHCRGCGQGLSASDQIRMERRQQFDLPDPRLVVKEFQRPISQCPCCGMLNQATFGDAPNVAAPVQYGPGIEALCVLLHNDYHIPLERVGRLLGDLFSQPVNAATILAAQHRAHDRLAASEQAIGEALLAAAVLHVDETGLRAAGKLHWLHGASTALLSYFFVHPKRGKEALWSDQSLLPSYLGRMIHDCFASYFKFDQADHSLCGSHLLREVEAFKPRQWAEAMHTLLLEAYWDVHERGVLDLASYYRYKKRYFAILRQGLEEHLPYVRIWVSPGRKKRGKARSLIHRLVRYHKQVWAFALDEAVPFTNNQAERDIRMVKLKQKINGGFRTKEGADVFARIAGFCSTVRKQGQSVFSELKRAMQEPDYVISLQTTTST